VSTASDSTGTRTDGTAPSNVAGNSRLTGSLGAVIFVLLFAEGLTIPFVREAIVLHVFVGMLLVAYVAAKIASTTYRFARYYSGRPAYVEKGPPPVILRLLGPVVTVLTVAVLGTGIAAVLDSRIRGITFAHKATFVLWFGAMTIHVLGHALETPALAAADWQRSRRLESPGATARLVLLGVTLVLGIGLAVWSIGWAHNWHQVHSR
jgi:hypothetical protein